MTDVSQIEAKGSGLEVTKETFLNRINEPDRANIEAIQKAFEDILRNKGLKGALLVVGGILTKPLPRKDIDIIVVIESDKSWQKYENNFKYAGEKFRELVELSEQIIERNPGFSIVETLEPAIDEEFGTPSILKHDGTLKLKKEGTTPIEFLNTLRRSTDETTRGQKQEFCVVARV